VTDLGERLRLQRDFVVIDPVEEIDRLLTGSVTADQWAARCDSLGIGHLPL
jgi:hypothetical protein